MMKNRETYQYDLLKRLAFNRFGGTEDELRAAELLRDEISALGGEGRLMPFEIPAYEIQRCALTVTAPFIREIDCLAWGHSGQLPEGGVESALRYIELNTPAAFQAQGELSGCAVLVNSLDFDLYRELVKRHAAAIIEISADKWYRTAESTDLLPLEMRPVYLAAGRVPVFSIRAHDAAAMRKDGAKTVRLELRQTSFTRASHNVLATIRGTENADECVVLTAHYDSVAVGDGAWDNASGAVTLMYLYAHFLEHPPKRTMRFIWCGSEEQGLLGSKAYVEKYEAELASVRMCFNFDMCGTALGDNCVDVAGSEELEELVRRLCGEAGYVAAVNRFVDSSDSASFADKGIPAVCPSRGHWTSTEFHTRYDRIDPISAEKLLEMGEFSAFLIGYFVNAETFPVPREMPEDMRERLDSCFYRKELAELEQERILSILSDLGLPVDDEAPQVTQMTREEDGEPYDVWSVDQAGRRMMLKKAKERELDVYRDFLSHGPAYAPRLYGTTSRPDGDYILMERVEGENLQKCNRSRLKLALDAIIEMQREYWNAPLTDRGCPYADSMADRAARMDYLPDPDLVRVYQSFLSDCAAVPKTLCHDDLLPFNVLVSPDRAVLIDWEAAGILPYPTSLARLIAHGTDDPSDFFYMTREDKAFAMEYYYEHLIHPQGIPYEDYRRSMELALFYEYCEWVFVGNKYGNTETDHYKRYLPLAKAEAQRLIDQGLV